MSSINQRIADLSPEKRILLEKKLLEKNSKPGSNVPAILKNQSLVTASLSFSQQRLWFLDQLEKDSALYNITRSLRLRGNLNITILQRAINAIISRHDSLRTTFQIQEGEPIQIIAPSLVLEMPTVNLKAMSEEEREHEVQHLSKEEAQQAFDLTRGPLIRFTLLRLSDQDYVLLLTIHHIISDGWSMGIFNRELSILYKAFLADEPSPLPELPTQYAAYAEWQRQWLRGEVLDAQLRYWKKQLKGIPSLLELNTDRPRPVVQSYRGAKQACVLSSELTRALKVLSKSEGVTLFMTLLAAFQVLLYRHTGQDDIVVGSPIANRTRVDIENLIGFFVNTLVLRGDLSGSPTFIELLARVRDVALGAYANQDLPFEKLVQELQPERSRAYSPLFQVMIILQNAPATTLQMPGLVLNFLPVENNVAKFDMTLVITDIDHGLKTVIEYNTDLFDAVTVERMLGHYHKLLTEIVKNPGQGIAKLPLLSDAEQQQLLVEWNKTAAEYPGESCVHQLFEEQVARAPQNVAVVCKDQSLTYEELNCKANQLAHTLRAQGVCPDTLVGICMERSLNMVIGLLGIMKAGGAYVPLDPSYPQERLAFMLEDTRVPLLLTQQALVACLPEHTATVLCLDSDWTSIASASTDNPVNVTTAEHLAYVIYTSGSTGKPKGTQVPHRAVSNFLATMKDKPGMCDQDILLAVTTISFDIAVLELYLPLIVGARVVVAVRDAVIDGKQLGMLMESEKITIMQATPMTWRILLGSGWSGPKYGTQGVKALCGGEPLTRELVDSLIKLGVEVWNMYGPTETTVWSTCHPVANSNAQISIGRPVANTKLYVLDAHMMPVPIGVSGELYIGGDGVTNGYLHRDDLTTERFVENPFSQDTNDRLYRTGDLVRYHDDGNIEYLYRLDNQVKVRGFRIELGEIEAALGQHPSVKNAVVLVREDALNDKCLVAYIVNRAGIELTNNILQNYLKKKLPEYMVPTLYVYLEKIPTLPNGKVDRKALPVPEHETLDSSTISRNPQDIIELQLINLWEKLLDVPCVSVGDNFFDLGGYSLLATRMITEIEKIFDREISVATIFETPTIEGLANTLRQKKIALSETGLVPLRTGGSKVPFFCIYGDVGVLSRYMDADQPLYWFWSRHQADPARLSRTARIEEIAVYYLEEIKRIQPHGPYLLGGFCVGGTLAYEISQKLKRDNEEVFFLALIDPIKPGPRKLKEKLIIELNRTFTKQGLKEKLTYVLATGAILIKRRIKRYLQRYISFGNRSKGRSGTSNQARLYVHPTAMAALARYKPALYGEPTTLFWPELQRGIRKNKVQLKPPVHWTRLLRGDHVTHIVPGAGHEQLFNEPFVKDIAKQLNLYLRDHQKIISEKSFKRP